MSFCTLQDIYMHQQEIYAEICEAWPHIYIYIERTGYLYGCGSKCKVWIKPRSHTRSRPPIQTFRKDMIHRRVGFFWFLEWVFPFPALFFSWIWFFSSCPGFFQFPLVFSVPVVGVFGSRLNTVFLVPTFGCFQFPFFFCPFLFVMGASASVPFPS